MQSNEILPEQSTKLRDTEKMILTLYKNHLKSGIRELLESNTLSVYDISENCFTSSVMAMIATWVPRGYSIVFTWGDKSKILQYNK